MASAASSGPPVNPLEPLLAKYRSIQQEIGKLQNGASQATTQICENELVLKELELLEEDAQVFKLIGPVLVKQRAYKACLLFTRWHNAIEPRITSRGQLLQILVQELVEVKSNVSKRIEYINADMKRIENTLKAKNEEQNGVKEQIQALQKKS